RNRQPGVEREHRHFDGKCKEKAPEEPTLQRIGEVLCSGEESRDVKSARRARRHWRIEVQRQDRQQHDYRSRQGVQKKFDGCVQPAVASPRSDQEVHRNEHHFPENVEEEEVERDEDADHAGLQEQQQNVVFLGPLMDSAPGRKDGDHAQERGEHDEQQRSEEHTSELQSPDHLVCRLLLEKKKIQKTKTENRNTDNTYI